MRILTFPLLLALAAPVFGQPKNGDIPPVSEKTPDRIRIPIDTAINSAVATTPNKGAEQGEQVAFTIAAQAKGWVPRGTSGILRSGMQCRVTVMIQGEIVHATETQRINESGQIGLPLLNNFAISNKSIETIEEQITEAYKEFYREPLVNVEYVGSVDDPSSTPWGFVTLIGNIGSPGPIAVPPTGTLTVSGAVKKAGGLAESAKPSSIRIFRPHPEDKTVERINVDLQDLGRRGEHQQDIILLPGDVLYVPERIL